jgi:hypothetical protein
MRSGSHVQLAALRNRDLELQTTSPFSNHGSWNSQQHAVTIKMFYMFGFLQICWVFQKFPFFLSPCTCQHSDSNTQILYARNFGKA